MRKVVSPTIIAKGNHIRADWWVLLILFLSGILRLFHLPQLTEFLGDQGRTSMILYTWVHGGSVPLVGPTTLTGQHLGPAFYFILAPFYILGGYSPLAVAIGMALLGVSAVYMLYTIVRMVYGRFPALCVSLLYAVSPIIVRQDRIIWEPNLVPLFGFIFAYFAIRQHDHVNFWDNVGLGAACGILIQLHYPNLFFLGLSGLLFFGHSIRVRVWGTFIKGTFGWIAGFVFVMTPFLMYEFAHGFIDISQILQIIHTGSVGMGKRQALMYALDYGGRVFGFTLPNISLPWVVTFFISWMIYLVIQFTAWNIFWTCWFSIGLLIIARYNGVVYDHYLLFLLPPVLLGLGSAVAWVTKKLNTRLPVAGVICLIVIVQLLRTDIFTVGTLDLHRSQAMTNAIAFDAKDSPFSFTLVSSRSFSDLHYRYYFLQQNIQPKNIVKDANAKLYVACDGMVCPTSAELISQKLHVLCYDAHCEGEYPVIDLVKDFVFEKTISVPIGIHQTNRVYVFVPR